MFKLMRRQWRYLTAKLGGRLEETADPKVQLEQAIGEAQEQHRRLVEQAANVIANQKQTELQLNRAMAELEKVNTSTRQALLMVEDARQRGDNAKAADYNQTAEAFANRLIATERQVQDLKNMHLQTTQAAQQAKAAVQQNSAQLQQRLAERQKLMSQLDQAKMQEQLNRAMTTLSQTVGQDVPSFEDVRTKIEARYAKALGTSELQGQTVEARMLEVEQASLNTEAQSRLTQMRGELGLAGVGPQGEVTSAPATGQLGAGVADPGTGAVGAGHAEPAPARREPPAS
ncbi:MAG TPA: PspA/IM30 family protein [Acidimicrobiales bacterium]|jgi:phage shock protein A|nr:PspA/IM30 family protein [Acidimicrobiales bacterium]